ncbi:MAG: YkgJ family cysteine cluster protein [Thermodesulfobacteriota bacterium]
MTASAMPICARCHGLGRGCCLAPAGPDHMFGLTQGEIAAISAASGLKPADFCLADRVAPDFLEFLAAINPVFVQTMPGGRRLRLRLDDTGACGFLGAEGCRLPVLARPLYCRLYPFAINPHGRLMVLISGSCLAQEGARSWREVLKRLDMDEAAVRALWARLEELAAAHAAGPPPLAPPPAGA